ncbi:MAG: hypothetical protein IKR85_01495 [Clostridia bacterium]|nr:hypothetical protein [Clostridia bacterium]
MAERNYAFRQRMSAAHTPGFRNDEKWKRVCGAVISDDWEVVYPFGAPALTEYAARDMAEFLSVSMEVYVRVRASKSIKQELKLRRGRILLATKELLPELSPSDGGELSYRLISDADGIVICANTPRGAAQGVYYVQDRMKIHEGPVLEFTDTERRALFAPRMVHSGFGLDMYPDEHLRQIARQGVTAILIFVSGVDHTPRGYLDFNDLIYRAGRVGLDVYAYNYMHCFCSPDDPSARERYEETYGRLFEACPGLKGIVMVGESCEFPSRDPHVAAYNWEYLREHPELNPEHKPTPGWYPCLDYPDWLRLVTSVIRSHKPDADCVFWTYNWGYVDEKARLELIRALPADISLMATFEMFEKFEKPDGVTVSCVDYTLSFEGPGKYFVSEAQEAHRRGIRLYTMSNTGGLTWDIGVIPYLPCPDQWHLRHEALLKSARMWGLAGLMDSHHYGFWPSIVSELAKTAFWEPQTDYETALRELIARDYGDNNVQTVRAVFRNYSQAIRMYVPTNPDQYGPYRIGPAYPLLFREEAVLESPDYAHFKNNSICNTMYSYDTGRLNCLEYELKSTREMERLLREANAQLYGVCEVLQGRKRANCEALLRLGRFMEYTAHTVINVKNWYLLKLEFLKPDSGKRIIAQKMAEIAEDEIANAARTIPLVEADSRLGYEPSMEYMCDRAHLEWKIRHTRKACEAVAAEAEKQ